ncbi:MAG: aminopeptidase P family protein [Chlamydiia bacterium]|nr:aminopeptidase P family protein [Chlamydiia bacterium]
MNQERIVWLQQEVAELGCDWVVVDDPTNLLYLTGLHLSAGVLLVGREAAQLFVDGRYIEKAKGAKLLPAEGWTAVLEQEPFRQGKRIGFNGDLTSYNKVEKWKGVEKKWVPLTDFVMPGRQIKDDEEIARIGAACDLACAGMDFAINQLKEGISEQELAKQIEIFWLERGAQGASFPPIVAFGANSSMPHYHPGDRKLQHGDVVLLDLGVQLSDYHSDMTRTVFFGEPDPGLLEVYEVVREAQQRAVDAVSEGIESCKLDQIARDWITKKGYGEQFSHSLGHGLGLEVHETPFLRQRGKSVPLFQGMVVTIEPGIYLPGIGGIRIEDTIVVGKEGAEILTHFSKEVIR